jgi:hypothetical protein
MESTQTIYYAMWIGFADVMAVLGRTSLFELPAREYGLFTGPLLPATQVITSDKVWTHTTPSLWWPADHAWCAATEVDFRCTYIGGSEACIRRLERDRRLEVLRTHPDHRADMLGDEANAWPAA